MKLVTHAMLAMFPEMTGWFNTQGAATEETTSVRDNDGGEVDGDSATEEEDQSEAGDLQEGSSTTEESTEPTSPPFPESPILPETENSAHVPEKGFGMLLVDARNAFNKLNRYVMLWELYHRCLPMHVWPSIDTATIASAS
jgi:hypothetical protein